MSNIKRMYYKNIKNVGLQLADSVDWLQMTIKPYECFHVPEIVGKRLKGLPKEFQEITKEDYDNYIGEKYGKKEEKTGGEL